MHTFIDESGTFTPNAGFSAVGALTVPSKSLRRLRNDLVKSSEGWVKRDGELKSTNFEPHDLPKLVDVLHQYGAILHVISINVAGENVSDIEAHKASQAEGITKNISVEHQPDVVKMLWNLRGTLERMPVQLYLQSIAMKELVCSTIEEAAMYFSQRRPRELGEFHWIVDAKDTAKITTQERWWRETLGPLVESRSRHQPFMVAEGPKFRYKYMHKHFSLTKDMWHPELPRESVNGLNIGKMLIENLSFNNSKADILIQAADVLTGFTRRVLSEENGDLKIARQVGRLQILRRHDGVMQPMQVFSLSTNPDHVKRSAVMKVMGVAGCAMLLK